MSLDLGLQVLKRSRPTLAPGDIFAWQHAYRPGRFHFGRVVSTEANLTGIPDVRCILIYLYRAWSLDKHAIPDLRHDLLLLPPIGTNRLAWTRGYFETVARQPLAKDDVLPQHCFTDGASFLDEHGRYLPGPVEPVGRYGLAGIGLIDELIGLAFDRPPVPSAWRPTLAAIVEAFREGDLELARGIQHVSPVSPEDAGIIAGNIEDYGDNLASLPDESWETSVCQWMDGYWHVLVDLYTEDEGASDLVLDVRVREREHGAGYLFEVYLVYVA